MSLKDADNVYRGSAAYGEKTTFTNTYQALTDVSGTKTWKGDDAAKRPESVTVQLLADGVALAGQTTDTDAEGNYSFENLPKYDADGSEINYTVEELYVPFGYEVSYDETHLNITNTYKPSLVSVEGTKTWDDNDDQDGKRPESITVNLLADGQEVAEQLVDAASGWTYAFENLPKFKDGQEIVYTITEDAVANYAVTQDGYNLTNSYTPGKTSVTVSKVWDDANNQDGLRPDKVTVQLYADDEKSGSEVTLSAENGWAYTWSDLALKAKGKDIAYIVKEVSEVEGYTSDVSGDQVTGFTITNRHKVAETAVSGQKTWEDKNDQDGLRPDSIEVQLYANGEKSGDVVVLSKDNNWTYIWNELDLKADKKEIVYSVSEISDVKGYQKTVSSVKNGQALIINHHVPTKPEGSEQTPPTPPNSTEDKKSSDKAPKLVKDIKKAIGKVLPSTGENSSILGFIGVGILALLAYYIIKRRKA